MNPLLSLQEIYAGYGSHEVVTGAGLTVSQGEFCALLGLNGCGKTTLLKAACGLLPVRQGHCLVQGQECTHLNEKERARLMAYIPQRGSLITGKTVMEVVLMGFNPHLRLLDSPGERHRQQALATLERLGLAQYAGRDYSHLSEGQKQLIILARAMVQDTPVMLMDEPDSALDFVNRNMVLGKIREIIHTQGRAGLITLHDPNFALAYCDRILLMRDGHIITEVTMQTATRQSLQQALGLIYGDIAVLEHPGGYAMVRAKKEESPDGC